MRTLLVLAAVLAVACALPRRPNGSPGYGGNNPGITVNGGSGFPVNGGLNQGFPGSGFGQAYPSFGTGFPNIGFGQGLPGNNGFGQGFPGNNGFGQGFTGNNGFGQGFPGNNGFGQPFPGNTGGFGFQFPGSGFQGNGFGRPLRNSGERDDSGSNESRESD